MAFSITTGTTGVIDPNADLIDSGWSISGKIASHSGCNAGTMKMANVNGLVIGRSYTITYEVLERTSGLVRVLCGTTAGTDRTAAGKYTETLTCAADTHIYFYSDGTLSIESLSFYDPDAQVDNSITITFNEDNKRWVQDYSFKPEMFIKFIDSMFALKNGQLWVHNKSDVRNNFYGQQYISQITFYVNGQPTEHKVFFSTRVESNRVWAMPNNGDISILPTEGKLLGMSSRLKKGNFKRLQGSYYADFLRNILDPTQPDELTSLFQGEVLRGRFMEVTITNDDTIEVILFEIDVKTAPSLYSY